MATVGNKLVVLGAGPSGCAAAITALQRGSRVIILEHKHNCRRAPGETLHPSVESIFAKLGIRELIQRQNFPRHYGVWRENEAGERIFSPYGADENGPWRGFQANRAVLNTLLRQQVVNLGGDIQYIDRLESVITDGAHVRGAIADGKQFHSDVVLDASGQSSWLARKLKLRAENSITGQRISFGWTNFPKLNVRTQPVFRERSTGWDWVAWLGDGQYCWVKSDFVSHGSPGTAWRIYRSCAGPGYFLVGDAACFMDPRTGNGVVRALLSGIYAVRLIDQNVTGQINSAVAAQLYQNWIGRMFDVSVASLGAPLNTRHQTGSGSSFLINGNNH